MAAKPEFWPNSLCDCDDLIELSPWIGHNIRRMKAKDIISKNADTLDGALVFTGTRVPVDTLIVHLKASDSVDTFLSDFPSVTREQVEAFIDTASASLAQEVAGAGTA